MAGMAEPRGEAAAASTPSFAESTKRAVVVMVQRSDDKDCSPQPGINLCEKPGISSSTVTWIVVGAVLGALLIATLSTLLFLHLRRQRRDKREDMEDRFQRSDYGLDDLSSSRIPRVHSEMKWSQDGSPSDPGRRSRDPLHAGTEPKYQGAKSNGHLNPFDDATSVRSGSGSSYPPSVNPQWPKGESSGQPNPPAQDNVI